MSDDRDSDLEPVQADQPLNGILAPAPPEAATIEKVGCNSLSEHIAILDATGRILSVSLPWGLRAADAKFPTVRLEAGQDYLSACEAIWCSCSDEVKAAAEGIRTVLHGSAAAFSFKYTCRTGSDTRWFRMLATPLRTDSQQGAVVIHENITDRQLAEEALRTSEAEFRLITEAMPQIVWIARADRGCIYLNQRWMDYTGLTLEESLGHGWLPPFHPEDHLRTAIRWQQATESGEAFEIEYRLRRADGQYHSMLGRALPLRDASGSIVKWFGTCTDIDDLKHAEAAAQKREEEQRGLASQLETERARLVAAQSVGKVGSWETDLESMAVTWSAETYRIFDMLPNEFGGTHSEFRELVHPSDRAAVDAAFLRSLEDHSLGVIEHRLLLRDGKIKVVEERWQFLHDESGKPARAIGTCQDMTERKLLEAQFLRAQRMDSLGTLASGIAHDMNNLLAPIVMGASFLKRFETGEKALSAIANIERSAKRGAELVKQVLSFTRGIDGARLPVELHQTVREVASIALNTFPKNVRIATDLPEELWLVMGDPIQLNQVLLNLCVNARDSMPEGGRILLRVTNLHLTDQQNQGITGQFHPPGRYLKLEVVDEGCGMPESVLDRIFEPFFTTKELGKGTGLGLSTVIGIVRSHGGFVRVSSEVNKGSVFEIFLPALSDSQMRESVGAESETLPVGHGELIMIVDDEEAIRLSMRDTLEAFGYRTILAGDGAEAAAMYPGRAEEIAVVITDMMMPVMDGPALIAALLEINPGVKIVGVSGLTSYSDALARGSQGRVHFLAKPYTADDILVLLSKLISNSPDSRDSQQPKTT